MNIISVITARSGSKGVPHKNIKLLAGHSLLDWTIKASLKSRMITKTILSTDSLEYAEIGKSCGAEVPFLRPSELSGDTATDLDVMKHSIDYLDRAFIPPNLIVHLRPTTPLRSPEVIDDAIGVFLKNRKTLTALRSVHEMGETAYKAFEISDFNFLTPLSNFHSAEYVNSSRQLFPKTYSANGYVDVLDCDFIRKNNKIHGDKIWAYKTSFAIEVDTFEDLEFLNWKVLGEKNLFRLLFGEELIYD